MVLLFDKITEFLDKRNTVDPVYLEFSEVVDMVHSYDTVRQQGMEINKKNYRTDKETTKLKSRSTS